LAEGQLGAFEGQVATGSEGLLRMGLIAVAAGAAIVFGLGKLAGTAGEAQKEVFLLEQALRASGQAANPAPYLAQATALQKLSGVQDEAIIGIQRLLVNFGATQEQVIALTPRILDFAAATGRDATSAAQLFGRALARGTEGGQLLKRVLGESVDLVNDFGGTIALLDTRFGGAAETIGNTLPGAFSKLRAAVNDLEERVGGPLLQPLTTLLNFAARLAEGLTALADRFPDATKAVVTFISVMGLLLLGGGGVLAVRAGIAALIPIFQTVTPAIALAEGRMISLGVATTATTFAFRALAAATVIGLIITLATVAIPLLIQNWDLVVAKFLQGATFIGVALSEIAKGFLEVELGLATLNFDRVKKGIDQMRNSFQVASEAGVKVFNERIAQSKAPMDEAAVAAENVSKKLAALRDQYDIVSKAARLSALQQEAAANSAARAQVSRPNLNEAALTAVEENRLRTIRRINIEELQARISQGDAVLAAARAAGQELSSENSKIAEEVAQARKDLETRRLEDVTAVAKDIIAQDKALAEERIRIENGLRRDRLDVTKAGADAERTVATERAKAEEDASNRRLELVRLEEETRLAMLRRIATAEIALARSVLEARGALLNALQTRQDTADSAAAQRRAELVSQGFLTEDQAAKQASDARIARTQQRLVAEVELEQERLRQIQRVHEIEIALAQIELQSKLSILNAESAAKIAQLQANARLREEELRSSIAIARAETEAKIAELQIVFLEKRRLLLEELKEREEAGLITPKERESREARIKALDDEFKAQTAGAADILKIRQDAAAKQIDIIAKATSAAVETEEKASQLRRDAIVTAHEATVLASNQKQLADATASLQRLAELEKTAQDEINRIRAEGFANFATEAEIQQKTSGIKRIQDSITSLFNDQRALVEKNVAEFTRLYQEFGRQADAALQPLVKTLDRLANPSLGTIGPGGTPATAPVNAVPTVAPPPRIENVTVPLVVDGKTLAKIVLRFLEADLIAIEQATP